MNEIVAQFYIFHVMHILKFHFDVFYIVLYLLLGGVECNKCYGHANVFLGMCLFCQFVCFGVHVCACMSACVCVHACANVRVCMHMYTCVHTHGACMCVHACMCEHA